MTAAHKAACLFAASLHILPRRLRWRVLLTASAPAARALPRGGYGGLTIDGYREIALWKLLMAAQQVGLRFDPVIDHRGRPPQPEGPGGRGTIVVGAHSLLNLLAVRHLHEGHCNPVVVSATPPIPLIGSPIVPRALVASPTLLPHIVRHLRGGEVICAMIDRPAAEKGTYRVDTAIGPIHVSDPLLKFAVKERAAIHFCTFRVAHGTVRADWAEAPADADSEAVKIAFGAFLQRCIEEGLGRHGPRSTAIARGRS
jgi:hypothetical protein